MLLQLGVNAATDYTDYGSFVVSNSGATATWDFTVNGPKENQYYKDGDSIHGIVNTSSNQLTYKGTESPTTLSAPKTTSSTNANLHIPVPSDAAGTITITGSSNNDARILYLMDSSGNATSNTIKYFSKGNSLTFTSSDLTTYNGNTYLRFDSIQTSGDYKIKSIVVNLTSGKYEATVERITVTVKESNGNVIKTDSLVEKGTAYSDIIKLWGKDFVGYYLDSTLETPYDSSILNSDTILYAKFNPWDSGKIANNYKLDESLMKELDGLSNLGSEIELTGTIYTLLASTSYTTTSNSPCISTGGEVSTTNKGIKIEVPAKGYISTLITTGGTSARKAKLIDSKGAEVTVSSGNTAWTADEAKAYEQRTLGYEVEAGTYYLGGDNTMRVLSVEFVPQEVTPLVQTAVVDTYTYVRFVSIVKGVKEFSAADITFKLTLTSGESNQEVTVTPYVVKKITSSGETYTAKVNEADYSFADHTAEYYVVYVVRFTTAKYTGDSIKATLTYAGNDYISSVVTI